MKKVIYRKGYRPTRKERKQYRLEMARQKALEKEQLMLIMLALVIKEGPAFRGEPKRVKCRYDKPSTIPGLVDYYLNHLTGLAADPLFTAIATLIASAQTQVGKLNAAEIAAQSKGDGLIEARNVELLNTEVIMDKVLGEIQNVGDNDPKNAGTIFKKHKLVIVVRKGHQREEMEVKHGDISGTFKVSHKRVAATAAYLYMISTDKLMWYVGDFSHNSSGLIKSMNDIPLKPGTLYYIKSKSSCSEGKSDWSDIVEMYCI